MSSQDLFQHMDFNCWKHSMAQNFCWPGLNPKINSEVARFFTQVMSLRQKSNYNTVKTFCGQSITSYLVTSTLPMGNLFPFPHQQNVKNGTVLTGQIRSAWVHWISLEKGSNRYKFLIFLILIFNFYTDQRSKPFHTNFHLIGRQVVCVQTAIFFPPNRSSKSAGTTVL
jgi:hypothetical protein